MAAAVEKYILNSAPGGDQHPAHRLIHQYLYVVYQSSPKSIHVLSHNEDPKHTDVAVEK